MKEFILAISPYEIYIWLLCLIIILFQIIKSIIKGIIWYKNKKNKSTDIITIANEIEISNENTVDRNDLDWLTITEKLLQHIDVENSDIEIIPNKIELMEKEGYNEEWTENINNGELQNQEVNNNNEGGQKQEIIISPEIYNTNTNHEQINKKKSQFDYLKNEIELLKSKWLMVEYEKKLIEATIDFPDDYYFNNALWDRYMESEDFKKAHTLFKKIYTLHENDDKILFKLWLINLELNDLSAAEFLVWKAKDLKPENPRYYQVLAEIKYNTEKIDESIELMERAVDLRPTKFEYVEILGKLYKETDNIQLYYKTLLKMNALEPLNQRVRWELHKFQN